VQGLASQLIGRRSLSARHMLLSSPLHSSCDAIGDQMETVSSQVNQTIREEVKAINERLNQESSLV
jgi:hypothetical protein